MADELGFGPFLALPAAARAELAARSRLARYRRDEPLMRPGEESDAAFALLSGRVRVIGHDGTVLAVMPAPALTGELAVLAGLRRSAEVVAVEPVRALRIPAAELRDVVRRHEGFARTLEAFADARRANAFLRRQGPFTELPSDEIEELAAHLRPVHFAAGALVMRQGERGDDVYLVREGSVEVVRTDGADERLLSRLGPGALVGEIAALTGSPRTATVRCATDVDALLVPGTEVRAVVTRHRALLERMRSVMQARHTPQRTGEHRIDPAPDDPGAVIVHDPQRGVYLRLDRQALAIYQDLDGERTLRDLSLRHLERTGTLDPHAVFSTVAALQVAGLVSAPRVATKGPDGRLLRAIDMVLGPRAELADADPAATALHRVLAPLFSRPIAAAAVVLGIGGLAAAVPVLRTASPTDFGVGGILVAFGGLLLAGVGHEMAHAIAAKAEGSRLGRAGIGLFWFTPVVYVDTSSTWSIPRWGRIRVNAAGPLFNLALAGALGLAARLAAGGVAQALLVWLSLTNVLLVAFNLSPLLEFDGYYVLADLTDTNALRRKAMRFVFGDLARRPRRPRSRREAGALLYVAAALAYVIGASAVALAGVPRVADSLLSAYLADPERSAVALLAAAAVAVTLVSPFVMEAIDARSRPEPGAA
ncbi:MAG: cyclic nucleotide-binding domain-containing protein [Chloroflexota bacterium]|nr:cyclic nucleotide-binding domain-containing protein [Chloroflexota bacterium]MDE3194235.1 cyclic nucleotide-binding domain-containing protein [Chloroflexota bacterium]